MKRTLLLRASFWNWVVARTCRNHSRVESAMNISATSNASTVSRDDAFSI